MAMMKDLFFDETQTRFYDLVGNEETNYTENTCYIYGIPFHISAELDTTIMVIDEQSPYTMTECSFFSVVNDLGDKLVLRQLYSIGNIMKNMLSK